MVYLLSPILTPFLLAAVIAYICNPMVSFLAARKIPRTLGTVLVMILLLSLFVALILIMVPIFEKEVFRLIEKIPTYLEMLKNNLIPWVEARFSVNLQPDIGMLKQAISAHWQEAGGCCCKSVAIAYEWWHGGCRVFC